MAVSIKTATQNSFLPAKSNLTHPENFLSAFCDSALEFISKLLLRRPVVPRKGPYRRSLFKRLCPRVAVQQSQLLGRIQQGLMIVLTVDVEEAGSDFLYDGCIYRLAVDAAKTPPRVEITSMSDSGSSYFSKRSRTQASLSNRSSAKA